MSCKTFILGNAYSEMFSRESWHLYPYFLERVHADFDLDASFIVEPIADALRIDHLSNQDALWKNASNPARDHTLARAELAVPGKVAQVDERIVKWVWRGWRNDSMFPRGLFNHRRDPAGRITQQDHLGFGIAYLPDASDQSIGSQDREIGNDPVAGSRVHSHGSPPVGGVASDYADQL